MKNPFVFLAIIVLLSISYTGHAAGNPVILEEDSANPYRPLYHFTPDSNWVNDPNGLVFFNGQFHVFTQYNPFGNKWGHMSWGHATSTDLLSWKQLPVAIPEFTKDSITTMIFSGSAVVDSSKTTGFAEQKGQVPMVAIYTSQVMKNNVGIAENQSIAYSLNNGKTWQQYAGNPVLDIHSKEFRDPKVFWYAPKSKWIMVAVKATEHKVQFYESANLKQWKLLSDFGKIGDTTKVWECPNLTQVSVLGSNEKKWLLTLSAGHPQKDFLGMQYFVGDFNGEKFTANPQPYPMYVEYGKDYYAGITYNNIPASDGRTIMIGWANCWRYANDIPTGKFRGTYAMPRELSLKKIGNQYHLLQQPIKELNALRKEVFTLNNQTVDSLLALKYNGNSYELELEINLNNSKTAGVKLLKSNNEETIIGYNTATKQLMLDRTKSGNVDFNKQFPSIETAPVSLNNGVIKLQILVDKSLIEVFANDGEKAMTDQVFPKESLGGIQLFTTGGKAVFKSVKIWTIK